MMMKMNVNTVQRKKFIFIMENVVLMKRENAKLIALNMIIIGKCLCGQCNCTEPCKFEDCSRNCKNDFI